MRPLRHPLLVAGLPAPGAAVAGFHPVEDRRYRYDTGQVRVTDGIVRRFHAHRTIVFHRTADGFDAVARSPEPKPSGATRPAWS